MSDSEEQPRMIGVVAVKLAPVWKNDVDLWFANAESQFELSNITQDSTKFNHVVSALTQDLAKKAASVIRNPLLKANTRLSGKRCAVPSN